METVNGRHCAEHQSLAETEKAYAQQTAHFTGLPYLELLGLGFLKNAQGSLVATLKLDLGVLAVLQALLETLLQFLPLLV